MKIVVINPNSSETMKNDVRRAAEAFADGRYEIEVVAPPEAPIFIDSYEDQHDSIPGMMRIVKEMQDEADAFVLACHGDPGLDVLKEISRKPVVGIGEASMKLATMLGHKFSVLTTSRRSIGGKEAVINHYHLTDSMASVCAPTKDDPADDEMEAAYLEAAHIAMERDNAEVLVLGCAGLVGLDEKLMEKVPVPVVDGVKCALTLAEGFARMHLTISKIGRYYGKTNA